VKYFIPEWNDRVDPKYDFTSDTPSTEHSKDPKHNDVYMWDIFGMDNVPVDGVLVSRIVIEQDKKRYKEALDNGIHKVLRLPQDFEILGDCGAFGYIEEKLPKFDPIETLQYYRDVGFNYGVSVDHLVVPQFEKEIEDRMRITYDNGVKSFHEWTKKYKKDFQLLVTVQGWEISDYLKMYKNYIELGATHIAFGGLVRSTTSFINELTDELAREIKGSNKVPSYIHFFGLARAALFPKFQELENLGVKVGFDSASYLRKAWLSAPTTQLNYLTINGKGYTAIRVPQISKKKRQKTQETLVENSNDILMKNLEQESLNKLRLYDKGEIDIESIMPILSEYNKAIDKSPELVLFYRRTLENKPWKNCDCPICKNIGIEVVLFRGNNRNRRRGFHNTHVFYKVVKNPRLWHSFMIKRDKDREFELSYFKKNDKVLVITGCTKEKLRYDNLTKLPAKKMYQGRLFKTVKEFSDAMGYDYVIISAKYGLVFPNDIIKGYEKVLQTKEDIKNIQSLVEEKLKPILGNYDKILVIAGEKYRKVLQYLWDERFIIVRSKGYADLCSIVERATPPKATLLTYTQQ